MTSFSKRDQRAYYTECPNGHFPLLDPEDPLWEKRPPAKSTVAECKGCGEHVSVVASIGWKVGYVRAEELDQGFSLAEPTMGALEASG
jgi:hypothetical protein